MRAYSAGHDQEQLGAGGDDGRFSSDVVFFIFLKIPEVTLFTIPCSSFD